MEKLYIAFYDDGHDQGDFEFYSEHRAGSKANKHDAYLQAVKKYGMTRANQIKITSTCKQ